MDGSRTVGEVTGVILAGGRASRFRGVNKATLDVDGRRIIDRQLEVLRQLTADQIIVANDASAYEGLGARIAADQVPEVGPIGGLLTGLTQATTTRILALACDLPFVHAAFLRHLIARAPEADAVVPRTADGMHPLCAMYGTRIAPAVAAAIARGEFALHRLLGHLTVVIVDADEIAPFDADGRLLTNVNTPEEYAALRLLAP